MRFDSSITHHLKYGGRSVISSIIDCVSVGAGAEPVDHPFLMYQKEQLV